MPKLIQAIIATALTALVVQTVSAGTKEELTKITAELNTIKQVQEQMQNDLHEIKTLLKNDGIAKVTANQAFVPTVIKLKNATIKGSNSAPVTLVEFSDYQCPYCRRYATIVLPDLLQKYVDTGKLRFVMREYPLPNLHPRATDASIAALCAGDQGDYWGMHDALFDKQKSNTNESFTKMAEDLGLDITKFKECLESDRHLAQIKADQVEGQKLGVSGTPSFVLGMTDQSDPNLVHLTKFIRGAQTLPEFVAAIEELLEAAGGK